MKVQNLWVAAAVYSALASAATAAENSSNEPNEVVIVTGSYIRGTAEDAALPVDVITSDDLEKRGSPSTLDLLKQLSVSNGVLGDTNQFDARAQGTEGTGSVNLRGLGPTRTLVLLNGRRLVSSPFGEGPVDTNLIPSAAIGRVEVLKDGAAATYGSDAIAGVVNFITKEDFRGLSLAANYKHIADSDGDYDASVAWGFGGDSTHFLLTAGYQHRSELLAKDRDFAHPSFAANPQGGWSASGNPASFVPVGVTAPTTANPLGAGATFRDPQCASLGGVAGLSGTTPVCYWQYINFDALTEKEDHYQVYAEFNQDLFSSSKLHAEVLYSGSEVPIYRTSPSYAALQAPCALAPTTGSPCLDTSTTPATAHPGTSPVPGQYYVPANNPGYVNFRAQSPANASLLSPTAGALVVAYRPFAIGGNPLFDYGSSEGPRRYNAFRVSTGLNGQINDSIGYDFAITYMEETAHRDGRDTAVNRLQLALRGLGGPNCNVAANTPGLNNCFWLNPFASAIPSNPITGQTNSVYSAAIDNNNKALIDWMFPVVSTEQKTSITVVDAVLNGKLGISLPGGDLGWAAGLQYRTDTYKTHYSDLYNFAITPCVNSIATGIVGPSACTAAQLAAPTGGLLFLGGGSSIDLDGDVKAGFIELSVPVFDSFQAQVAARYEDYGGDIGSTFDPKLSLRWQLIDGLALRGSVGTTFRGPRLANTDPGSITSLQSISGVFRAVRTFGNPALAPESAFNFNVGAIGKVGGLSVSLDYWSFDFDKQIVTEPVAGIVNAVFGPGGGGCTSPLINRFAFTAAGCAAANIARLDIGTINGPKVKTSGIDFSMQLLMENMPGGDVTFGGDLTYVNKYDIEALSISGVLVQPAFDAVGKLNYQTTAYPLPKWKGSLFIEYVSGIHNVRYQLNHIDSYVDQRVAEFATNSNGKTIASTTIHNVYYRLQLPADLTVTAGVENFLNEDPSFARLDYSYDPFTGSALGRVYKVGASKKF